MSLKENSPRTDLIFVRTEVYEEWRVSGFITQCQCSDI